MDEALGTFALCVKSVVALRWRIVYEDILIVWGVVQIVKQLSPCNPGKLHTHADSSS